jgi:hypothetical protein
MLCSLAVLWTTGAPARADDGAWAQAGYEYGYFGLEGGYSGALGFGLGGAGYDETLYWHGKVEAGWTPAISPLVQGCIGLNLARLGPGDLQLGIQASVYILGGQPTWDTTSTGGLPGEVAGVVAIGLEAGYHLELGRLRLRPALALEGATTGQDPVYGGLAFNALLHAVFFIVENFVLFGDLGYTVISISDADLGDGAHLGMGAAQAHLGLAYAY